MSGKKVVHIYVGVSRYFTLAHPTLFSLISISRFLIYFFHMSPSASFLLTMHFLSIFFFFTFMPQVSFLHIYFILPPPDSSPSTSNATLLNICIDFFCVLYRVSFSSLVSFTYFFYSPHLFPVSISLLHFPSLPLLADFFLILVLVFLVTLAPSALSSFSTSFSSSFASSSSSSRPPTPPHPHPAPPCRKSLSFNTLARRRPQKAEKYFTIIK